MEIHKPVGQIASISGGQIEYCLSGNGPTVLISHGTLGGLDQGFSIARLFNQEIFRFLSISRAGYLNSSPNTGRTSKEQARSYVELLDAEGVDSVAIIGISGGAPSALCFAQDYPERCWGLVLISSITKMPKLPPFFKLVVQMQDFMMRVDWPWKIVHRYGLGMMARAYGASSKQVSNMRRDPHLWSVIKGIYEPIKTAHLRRRGMKIDDTQIKSLPVAEEYDMNVPVYVSHAVNDPLASFEDARSFASRFPQATFHDILDGGHIFFVVHNERVIPKIEQFLLANTPKSTSKLSKA
ncbi:MAG: alpha/beta hydrolase [Chloroflexi bacterium]|nr:MAG: alpha/beta hydrolase [Chloroflexota bacterium]